MPQKNRPRPIPSPGPEWTPDKRLVNNPPFRYPKDVDELARAIYESQPWTRIPLTLEEIKQAIINGEIR